MSIRRYEHSSGALRLHREGALVSFADHEAELAALRTRAEKAEAEVERLRETLKSTATFLHHCWCEVQMNDYSFQKLNEQMEIVDAAIDAAMRAEA